MRAFDRVRLGGASGPKDSLTARSAIAGAEVVHFARTTKGTGPDDLRRYYDELVEGIGEPYEIAEDFRNDGAPTGERWSEIRYDSEVPDDEAFRYSKNAQPLHTDESYVSTGAGVMFFYCVAAAPAGGETEFVSGRSLVEYLRTAKQEMLDRLLTTDVRYLKARDAKHRPIIRVDGDGAVDLNYNYFCADLDQSAAAIDLNEEFHQFLQHELPGSLVRPVALRPGEAVSWRDSLVLHVLKAFTANRAGDR